MFLKIVVCIRGENRRLGVVSDHTLLFRHFSGFAVQVTKLDKMDRSINLIYLDSKQGLFRTSLSLASNRLLFNLKAPFQPAKKQLADIAKLGALVAKEQLAGSH